MSDYASTRVMGRSAALIAAALLYGCQGPPDSSRPAEVSRDAPIQTMRPEPVATVVDARPAALVNGRGVLWGALRPALTEAAGAQALQEAVLDHELERLAERNAIVITEVEVAAERKRLIETLHEDPTTALRLLEELRDRQRLGPYRFRQLMWRNALMRALVQDRVDVNEAAVQSVFDVLHGPKRQVRLITVPDLRTAETAIDRIEAGAFFGDVAVETSTDASAARGGLLAPVSQRDPSYPRALRHAIWLLAPEPSTLSEPILMSNGYAVVQLVREIEGEDVTLEAARPKVELIVRMNQERLLMDELARSLLENATVSIFDDALNDSWKRSQRTRP